MKKMEQFDLFGKVKKNNSMNKIKVGLNKINNGELVFKPDFFNSDESKYFLENLKNTILWKQESMNMYGKRINFPRLTSWYGENDKFYSYSGIKCSPNPWTNDLIEIKQKIDIISNNSFNSVLLNLYRDGKDSMSWHTDAEKELGKNPIIASVNFGATRKFQLRHLKTKEKLELELSNGSLLIMQGELQHYWEHQIPKTKTPVSERINLTFRVIQ